MNNPGRSAVTNRGKSARPTGARAVATLVALGLSSGLGWAGLGTAQAEPMPTVSAVAHQQGIVGDFDPVIVDLEDKANKAFDIADQARKAADEARAKAREIGEQKLIAEGAYRDSFYPNWVSKRDAWNLAKSQLVSAGQQMAQAGEALRKDPNNPVKQSEFARARAAVDRAIRDEQAANEEHRLALSAAHQMANHIRDFHENRERMALSALRSALGTADVANQEFEKAKRGFEDAAGAPFTPKPVERLANLAGRQQPPAVAEQPTPEQEDPQGDQKPNQTVTGNGEKDSGPADKDRSGSGRGTDGDSGVKNSPGTENGGGTKNSTGTKNGTGSKNSSGTEKGAGTKNQNGTGTKNSSGTANSSSTNAKSETSQTADKE